MKRCHDKADGALLTRCARLVDPCRRIALAQILAQAVVELPLSRGQRESLGVHLTAPEDRGAVCIGHLPLCSADHHAPEDPPMIAEFVRTAEELVIE